MCRTSWSSKGLNIQTYLTIFSVFFSKYFISNESIIDKLLPHRHFGIASVGSIGHHTFLSIKKWSQQVSSHRVERHLYQHH